MDQKLPWFLLAGSWLLFAAPKEKLNQLIVTKTSQKLPWLLLLLTWGYLFSPEKFKNKVLMMLGKKPKRIHTAKFPKPPRVEQVSPSVGSETSEGKPSAAPSTSNSRRINEYTLDEFINSLELGPEQPHQFKKFSVARALFHKIVPLDGWETQQSSNGVTISQLQLKNQSLPFVRGDGIIKGFSCEEISSIIINPFARATCNKQI
jgi:hypothetical protein